MGFAQGGYQTAESPHGEGGWRADGPSLTAHHAACSGLLMPSSCRDYTLSPFSHSQIPNPFPFPAEITSYLPHN